MLTYAILALLTLIVLCFAWYGITETFFKDWKKAKARFLFQLGKRPARPFYVRTTPHFGFGLPWFATPAGNQRRIRYGPMHGCQIVRWVDSRWVVERQILPLIFGRSKVKKEMTVGQAMEHLRRKGNGSIRHARR